MEVSTGDAEQSKQEASLLITMIDTSSCFVVGMDGCIKRRMEGKAGLRGNFYDAGCDSLIHCMEQRLVVWPNLSYQ
jgi:hypothetical protein